MFLRWKKIFHYFHYLTLYDWRIDLILWHNPYNFFLESMAQNFVRTCHRTIKKWLLSVLKLSSSRPSGNYGTTSVFAFWKQILVSVQISKSFFNSVMKIVNSVLGISCEMTSLLVKIKLYPASMKSDSEALMMLEIWEQNGSIRKSASLDKSCEMIRIWLLH